MDLKRVHVVESGAVWRKPDHVFGYAAWPSVCKDSQGRLTVAFSGCRIMHVCPYGKVLVMKSKDEGRTWSSPIIAIDTPLDDRDAGILHLGGGKMLVTSFNNSREVQRCNADRGIYGGKERLDMVYAYLPNVTDKAEEAYLGYNMAVSEDDGCTWSEPYRVPVSAPHGPTMMRDGTILYAGIPYGLTEEERQPFPIWIYTSKDGKNFDLLAKIPKCPEIMHCLHCEAHILELPSGRLLLHIRVDEWGKKYEERLFSTVQTWSDDGGKTWTVPKLLNNGGAPPHLMQHSSGALICTYGKRRPPYGIQVMISYDEGETWDMDYYVREQGDNADIGYPCSIELDNGDIFTVYYCKADGDAMASIFYSRWQLPEKHEHGS